MIKEEQIAAAMLANCTYGDDGFEREGKFPLGAKVKLSNSSTNKERRSHYFGQEGVVVRRYVTINAKLLTEFRNPAYRVLFKNGKVISLNSYDIEELIEKEVRI